MERKFFVPVQVDLGEITSKTLTAELVRRLESAKSVSRDTDGIDKIISALEAGFERHHMECW